MSYLNNYHTSTEHSYLSIRQDPNRLDWERQPSAFKIYPDSFRRIPVDMEKNTHRLIYRVAGVTAKKSYPGIEYYLRTNPSAGALYPNELYFQARDIDGFEDGIYHYNVAQNACVLLHALQNDGLEPHLGLEHPMRGFLFLISSPYYRSSWKYRNRAFRYCLLDGGHLLGAVEASSFLKPHACRFIYRFDRHLLNELFGFGRDEFFLSAACVALPDRTYNVKAVTDMQLPAVDPTGFFEANALIETAYSESCALEACKSQPRHPEFRVNREVFEEAIFKRRSAREFAPSQMQKEQFEAIMQFVMQPIPSDCDETVEVYCVINRVVRMPIGLYRDGEYLEYGDFAKKAEYLCLEQKLGSQSAVTIFLTGSGNYQPLYQKVGIIGHRLYLAAVYYGFGCSGIGAYYDREVQEFLNTDALILYALAIGS